jgi:hypothetical protein
MMHGQANMKKRTKHRREGRWVDGGVTKFKNIKEE